MSLGSLAEIFRLWMLLLCLEGETCCIKAARSARKQGRGGSGGEGTSTGWGVWRMGGRESESANESESESESERGGGAVGWGERGVGGGIGWPADMGQGIGVGMYGECGCGWVGGESGRTEARRHRAGRWAVCWSDGGKGVWRGWGVATAGG